MNPYLRGMTPPVIQELWESADNRFCMAGFGFLFYTFFVCGGACLGFYAYLCR